MLSSSTKRLSEKGYNRDCMDITEFLLKASGKAERHDEERSALPLCSAKNLLLRQTLGIPKGDACNKQERADQGRERTPAAKPDCPEGHEAEGATGQCREAGQD